MIKKIFCILLLAFFSLHVPDGNTLNIKNINAAIDAVHKKSNGERTNSINIKNTNASRGKTKDQL